jgi:hypothetical protein
MSGADKGPIDSDGHMLGGLFNDGLGGDFGSRLRLDRLS